jgi:hypothetical protein
MHFNVNILFWTCQPLDSKASGSGLDLPIADDHDKFA